METEKRPEKNWRSNAVAACVAVAFYVLLTHLDTAADKVFTFLGYFRPVIFGGVLAYLMNPLATWYQNALFKRVRAENFAGCRP